MIKDEEYERIKSEIEKRQTNAFICLHKLITTPHFQYSAADFERTKNHLHNICENYNTILSCINKNLTWEKLSYETLIIDVKICHLKREIEKLELTQKMLMEFNREFIWGDANGSIRY